LGKDPLSETEWTALRALYEGELRLVDSIARQIVAAVGRDGDPSNTLVFLLSDHGENLGDHGHLTHIFNLYDTNLRIALLARGPGFAPSSTEKRLVQITDLYPTILKAAGLEPEAHCAGLRSARQAAGATTAVGVARHAEDLARDVSAETRASGVLDRSQARALGRGERALQGDPRFRRFARECLTSSRIQVETTPLVRESIDANVLKGLEAFIDITRAKATARTSTAEITNDPAVHDALRALGYVE
jgi:arylsulfatase A-like enzyme